MAVILGDIFGLRLRAQHDLVDDILILRACDAGENAVELMRRQHLALGQLDVDRGEKFARVAFSFSIDGSSWAR